jgi:hypothetical protein
MIRGMHVYLPLIYAAAILGGVTSAAAIQHFRTMNSLMYGLGGNGYGSLDYGAILHARRNNRRAKAIKRSRRG